MADLFPHTYIIADFKVYDHGIKLLELGAINNSDLLPISQLRQPDFFKKIKEKATEKSWPNEILITYEPNQADEEDARSEQAFYDEVYQFLYSIKATDTSTYTDILNIMPPHYLPGYYTYINIMAKNMHQVPIIPFATKQRTIMRGGESPLEFLKSSSSTKISTIKETVYINIFPGNLATTAAQCQLLQVASLLPSKYKLFTHNTNEALNLAATNKGFLFLVAKYLTPTVYVNLFPETFLLKLDNPTILTSIQKHIKEDALYIFKPVNEALSKGIVIINANKIAALISWLQINKESRPELSTIFTEPCKYLEDLKNQVQNLEQAILNSDNFFIIQEFHSSRRQEFKKKFYDPTFRIILEINDDGNCLPIDMYGKCPLEDISSENPLRSYISCHDPFLYTSQACLMPKQSLLAPEQFEVALEEKQQVYQYFKENLAPLWLAFSHKTLPQIVMEIIDKLRQDDIEDKIAFAYLIIIALKYCYLFKVDHSFYKLIEDKSCAYNLNDKFRIFIHNRLDIFCVFNAATRLIIEVPDISLLEYLAALSDQQKLHDLSLKDCSTISTNLKRLQTFIDEHRKYLPFNDNLETRLNSLTIAYEKKVAQLMPNANTNPAACLPSSTSTASTAATTLSV